MPLFIILFEQPLATGIQYYIQMHHANIETGIKRWKTRLKCFQTMLSREYHVQCAIIKYNRLLLLYIWSAACILTKNKLIHRAQQKQKTTKNFYSKLFIVNVLY